MLDEALKRAAVQTPGVEDRVHRFLIKKKRFIRNSYKYRQNTKNPLVLLQATKVEREETV